MTTQKESSPLTAVFFVDRSDRGRLRLTGRDRQSFLQGMVTGDVARLHPGQGCYAFMLDATGHILADMRVLCAESHLLLDVEPGLAPFVAATLDRYLIMEKCRIADVTDETAQVFVGGAAAPEVLAQRGISGSNLWAEGQNAALSIGGVEATVAATRLIPGPGFDIYAPADARAEVIEDLREAGVAEITAAALDAFRVEAGVPRQGVDMNEKVLAPETAQQTRAISYRKGCYIGQEIVARIDARGHTNRTFAGFLLEGERVPENGEKVMADGREVGWTTSCVLSPTLHRPIALGYLRQEHAQPGTSVVIGDERAVVAALPLVTEPPGESQPQEVVD